MATIAEYEDYLKVVEENRKLTIAVNEREITIRLLSKRCRELGESVPLKDDQLACATCANYGVIRVMPTEEGHIALSGCVCPEIGRLRDVLNKLARLGNEPNYGNSFGNIIARQALRDTVNE